MATTYLKDKPIEIMIEYVYEEETNRKNWDSSWIESVRTQYYSKGITENQKKILEKRYNEIVDKYL